MKKVPYGYKFPVTIATMIEQIGGRGISGAFAYVGAFGVPIEYQCPDVACECRGSTSAWVPSVHGGSPLEMEDAVGLQFKVNGKRGEDWHICATYEANDTCKVFLLGWVTEDGVRSRRLLDYRDDVYCDQLKEVVEKLYDNAIANRNQGFIHLS